jgi:hypothetical protein
MAVIDGGNGSAGKADVTTNHELRVIGPDTRAPGGIDPGYTGGFATMVGEIDAGTVTGKVYQRAADISEGYRLRVGVDSILFFDQFAGLAVNTSIWNQVASTSTITVANGYLNLNAGSAVASGNVARVQTYRTFPVYGQFPLIAEWVATYVAPAAQLNSVVEMGFGLAATTAAPTDGVFFRWNALGEFWCVVSFGGTETLVAPSVSPTLNERHKFMVVIGNSECEFWIDDVLYAEVEIPASSPGAVATSNLPLFFRNANTGIVPSAVQLRVAQTGVFLLDALNAKSWGETQVGMGLGAYQAPTGYIMGGTSNYAVSAAPATGTLGNTTPSFTTLGGQFKFLAPGAAETDFPVFAYGVTAGTAAIPGKNLVVTGIWISTYSDGAIVATTPTVLQWGLGIGHTQASLATVTEGAGVKLRRVIPLGLQSWTVGAVTGAMANVIERAFYSPVIIEPGTWLHVMMKPAMGTATAGQYFRGLCGISGYWE